MTIHPGFSVFLVTVIVWFWVTVLFSLFGTHALNATLSFWLTFRLIGP